MTINKAQLEAQTKSLEIQEKQMQKLDKVKDEAWRIYKNASEKKHPGKCIAFYYYYINADHTILEWKALGFTVISEISNSALSAVNGAIDITKAVPSVVSDVARAVGNLGTFGSAPMGAPGESGSRDQTEKATPAAFPDASDPAFEKAYEIDELTSRLSEIITGNLVEGVEKSTKKRLFDCLTDIKSCKVSLEAEKRDTSPSQNACKILGDCEKVCSTPSSNNA